MRKAYVKPQIYFDNFELSQDIAAGCTNKVKNPIVMSPTVTVFGGEVEATCTIDYTAAEDDGCYHVFEQGGLFTS